MIFRNQIEGLAIVDRLKFGASRSLTIEAIQLFQILLYHDHITTMHSVARWLGAPSTAPGWRATQILGPILPGKTGYLHLPRRVQDQPFIHSVAR